MNYKLMLRLLGRCLLVEAVLLLLPLLTAVYYGESPLPFAWTVLILTAVGLSLSFLPAERSFFAREGFVIGSAVWIFFCLFGALPFLFSGYFGGYVNCLFEITSGFTTTGASMLSDVEILPHGILFWRSFSSWLGGMGVLIFTLALLPGAGERTHNLARAETTGPISSKLVPKTAESSRILYLIYIVLTVLEIVCLRLAGMPLFDALLCSFATICTGGMSIKNLSIAAYASPMIENIVLCFILLSAVNFALYFLLLTRRFRTVLRSDELRWFFYLLGGATVFVALNLFLTGAVSPGGAGETLRQTFFQTASILTTTGFTVVDFNGWPEFSQMVLLGLMIVGGCAGGTSGGIKVSRLLLLLRVIRRDLRSLSHPRVVKVVKLDGNAVDEHTLSHVAVFFGAYALLLAGGCLLVALDGLPIATTITAVIASLGNVGPGLDLVGPLGNYGVFSGPSKLVLSLCMLIGRLEIFPILLLLNPSAWRRT